MPLNLCPIRNEQEGIPVELIQHLNVCVEVSQEGIIRSMKMSPRHSCSIHTHELPRRWGRADGRQRRQWRVWFRWVGVVGGISIVYIRIILLGPVGCATCKLWVISLRTSTEWVSCNGLRSFRRIRRSEILLFFILSRKQSPTHLMLVLRMEWVSPQKVFHVSQLNVSFQLFTVNCSLSWPRISLCLSTWRSLVPHFGGRHS